MKMVVLSVSDNNWEHRRGQCYLIWTCTLGFWGRQALCNVFNLGGQHAQFASTTPLHGEMSRSLFYRWSLPDVSGNSDVSGQKACLLQTMCALKGLLMGPWRNNYMKKKLIFEWLNGLKEWSDRLLISCSPLLCCYRGQYMKLAIGKLDSIHRGWVLLVLLSKMQGGTSI